MEETAKLSSSLFLILSTIEESCVYAPILSFPSVVTSLWRVARVFIPSLSLTVRLLSRCLHHLILVNTCELPLRRGTFFHIPPHSSTFFHTSSRHPQLTPSYSLLLKTQCDTIGMRSNVWHRLRHSSDKLWSEHCQVTWRVCCLQVSKRSVLDTHARGDKNLFLLSCRFATTTFSSTSLFNWSHRRFPLDDKERIVQRVKSLPTIVIRSSWNSQLQIHYIPLLCLFPGLMSSWGWRW